MLNKTEQEMFDTLIAYIYVQPMHYCGLCYWLSHIGAMYYDDYDEDAPQLDGYQFVDIAMKLPEIKKMFEAAKNNSHGSYVTKEEGPTSERVELARRLAYAIEKRQLTYENGWWGTT